VFCFAAGQQNDSIAGRVIQALLINIVTTYFSKGMAMIIQFRRTALQLTVAALFSSACYAQAADSGQSGIRATQS